MKRAVLLFALFGLACCTERPDAGKTPKQAGEETPPATATVEEPKAPATPQDATRDHPFINSMQMEFVPVPEKKGVLMCRMETRIKDFRAYVESNGYIQEGGAFISNADGWLLDPSASWDNPGFKQGEEHPVSCVNWAEAKAFCTWLTEQDRAAGLIGANDRYRLPNDEEWSLAAGIQKPQTGDADPLAAIQTADSEQGATNGTGKRILPVERALNLAAKALEISPAETFPPDPGKTGKKASQAGSDNWMISGYRNPHPQTSPAGKFPANRFGFYDLGGNVWEWCEDHYQASMNDPALLAKYELLKNEAHEDGTAFRVLRGISWHYVKEPALLFSLRNRDHPNFRNVVRGFRAALELDAGSQDPGNGSSPAAEENQ